MRFRRVPGNHIAGYHGGITTSMVVKQLMQVLALEHGFKKVLGPNRYIRWTFAPSDGCWMERLVFHMRTESCLLQF